MPLKVVLYLTQKRHATLVGVLLDLTQRRHATLVDAQEAEIEFFQVKHAPWNFHGMLEDTMVRPWKQGLRCWTNAWITAKNLHEFTAFPSKSVQRPVSWEEAQVELDLPVAVALQQSPQTFGK